MKKNFMTTQDVIDICSRLYDEGGYGREEISTLLWRWRESGLWQVSYTDMTKVFDLIVG